MAELKTGRCSSLCQIMIAMLFDMIDSSIERCPGESWSYVRGEGKTKS